MSPEWRIYYWNGATFDSNDGNPVDAPQDGVICIVGYSRHGRRYIACGYNWYRWEPDDRVWLGIDWHGIIDRLRMGGGFIAFKEGRMMSNDGFQAMMARAHRDPDFPIDGRD